jgi:pentatricopeptide repeat protein
MQKNGVAPDVITFTSIIDAYGKDGDLESMLWMYKKVNLFRTFFAIYQFLNFSYYNSFSKLD